MACSPLTLFAALAAIPLGFWPAPALRKDPAVKCEATKLQTAGEYDSCLLNANAGALKSGGTPDFSKCDQKYSSEWTKAETKAGGMCLSNGDEAAIQAFITQCTDDVATALAGGPLPDCPGDLATCNSNLSTCNATLAAAQACGNGILEAGEDCDQANLNGQTCITQGFASGTLACGAGCKFDTSACSAVRFVDNGDGTVTDTQTRLTWEKKQNLDGAPNASDPHDADNRYTWSTGTNKPDGTAFTDFLYALNGGTSPDIGEPTSGCFTDHCDWRLPTVEELQTILLAPYPCGAREGHVLRDPCIDPVFGPDAGVGTWSATTDSFFSDPPGAYAWFVSLGAGLVGVAPKTFDTYLRAVRGGL